MFCLVKTGCLGFIYEHLSAVENQPPWVFRRAKGYLRPPTRAAGRRTGCKTRGDGEAKSLQIDCVLVLLMKEVFPLGVRRANGTTLRSER